MTAKQKSDRPQKQPAPKSKASYSDADDVLEASLESFPASDPPSYAGHTSPVREEKGKKDSGKKDGEKKK